MQSNRVGQLFTSSAQVIIVLFFVLFISCQDKSTETNETTEAKKEKPEKVDTSLAEMTLRVKGMTCTGCENTIKSGLEELKGVASVKASHKDSMAIIQYTLNEVTIEQIRDKIKEKGYVAGDILSSAEAK